MQRNATPQRPRHLRVSTRRHTEALAVATTEDPGDTVAVTTEGEDTVDETTAIKATEAGGTTTGTQTTPRTEGTAQATENPEARGTPGGCLETGRTEGGTTAAMAEDPATATRTPEAIARAAESPEDE